MFQIVTRLDSRSTSAKRIPRGNEFCERRSSCALLARLITGTTTRTDTYVPLYVSSQSDSLCSRLHASSLPGGALRIATKPEDDARTRTRIVSSRRYSSPVEAASRSDTFRKNLLHDTVNDRQEYV